MPDDADPPDSSDDAPEVVHVVLAEPPPPPARRPSVDTASDAAIAAALAADAGQSVAAAHTSTAHNDNDDPTRDDEALAWALHEAEAEASRSSVSAATTSTPALNADTLARAASGDAGPPAPWRAVLERVAAARVAAAPARAHVPRVASWFGGDAAADHARLTATLAAYGLAEWRVVGDGNCQFRALSHQLYGAESYHPAVRAAAIAQLAARPDLYADFVLGDGGEDATHAYTRYLATMAADRAWGDHVTLQAAADALRSRVVVVSTFQPNPIINVDPSAEVMADTPKGPVRTLFLSFWAEIHYNSVLPAALEGGNASVFGARRPAGTPERIRRWFQANF